MGWFEAEKRRYSGRPSWSWISKERVGICALVWWCALSAYPQFAKTPAASLTGDLDRFVADQLQRSRVPGAAIAVVQNGQVIYASGFGLRDVNAKLPVTTKTVFAIGSISKSFTALSMGMLNDEGKLDWDKPVRQYLPEFEMYDPVASERMTPRDLISHRVGMAGHDLIWYSSDFSREEVVHRLRFLQSDHDFRSGYHYNNLLVATAGYLVGRIADVSWEDFVRSRIFQPLQMTSSNFSVAESQKLSDFAHPYGMDEHSGAVSEIPFHPLESIGPAGSINSNVEDMARYAIFQLGNGKTGGRQLISEANLTQNHMPEVPMPDPSRPNEIGPRSYAMGWVISSYRGHALWWHNGGIDGFYAMLMLLPDENFGVVILTNMLGHNSIPEIVSYHLFDRLLGLPAVDWTKHYQDLEDEQKKAEEKEEQNERSERKPETHPSHELKEYAGRYENSAYGALAVEFDGEGLKARLNKLPFALRHDTYDVFESLPGTTGAVDIGKIRFLVGMDGSIDAIAAPLEPDAPEIVFTRVHQSNSPQQAGK